MTEYSNPRMSAIVTNWPSGGKRVTAKFEIERDAKRGERGVRTTTGKRKKLTYGRAARVVDGDDGRTYVAVQAAHFGFITIFRGDFKYAAETIFPDDSRYTAVRKPFDPAAP
jgi:hypothetical protein